MQITEEQAEAPEPGECHHTNATSIYIRTARLSQWRCPECGATWKSYQEDDE